MNTPQAIANSPTPITDRLEFEQECNFEVCWEESHRTLELELNRVRAENMLLIAVARAANGLSMGSDWNHGTHAKEHGYRQQLIDALQALRATGKVTL